MEDGSASYCRANDAQMRVFRFETCGELEGIGWLEGAREGVRELLW